jgi:hypothetical protein
MTSVLWALANIEFQTFDRRIDRRRPSPATLTHTSTNNSLALRPTLLLPNLCRNASKKDPAPRGTLNFPQKTIKISPRGLVIHRPRSSRLLLRPAESTFLPWSRLLSSIC